MQPNQIPLSSPSWLTPPVLHQPPPLEMKVAPAPVAGSQAPPRKTASRLAVTHNEGPIVHFLTTNRSPSKEQYAALKEFFARHPELKLRSGRKHPERENYCFIAYSSRSPNGERWGTKQQLADMRASRKASNKAWRKSKMETDPDFRAKRRAELAQLGLRDRLVGEALAEKIKTDKAAAVKRAQKSRRAKAAKAKARAAKKAAKGLSAFS